MRNRKQKILKKGRFISLMSCDGWEYVQRTNCDGIVIILAVNSQNQLLLVEQYRIPVAKNVIEFPAGLVNDLEDIPKESFAQAAKRELLEETGYLAKKMVKVVEGSAGGGLSADIITFYKAVGIKKVLEGCSDPKEVLTLHEIPLSNVEKWLNKKGKEGCLVDPKIYAGLYFLKKYNRKD